MTLWQLADYSNLFSIYYLSAYIMHRLENCNSIYTAIFLEYQIPVLKFPYRPTLKWTLDIVITNGVILAGLRLCLYGGRPALLGEILLVNSEIPRKRADPPLILMKTNFDKEFNWDAGSRQRGLALPRGLAPPPCKHPLRGKVLTFLFQNGQSRPLCYFTLSNTRQ